MFLLGCAWMAGAQESIRVHYQGEKPTIRDFVQAYLFADEDADEEESMGEPLEACKEAWERRTRGLAQPRGESLTIDSKNGYVCYESKYQSSVLRVEMCYWNESDGKHKLFACNIRTLTDGRYYCGQYDGLLFYRYNNATEVMTRCDAPGFEALFTADDGNVLISYALPRTGKDIAVTYWYEHGTRNKTLHWNGRSFSL